MTQDLLIHVTAASSRKEVDMQQLHCKVDEVYTKLPQDISSGTSDIVCVEWHAMDGHGRGRGRGFCRMRYCCRKWKDGDGQMRDGQGQRASD